MAEALTVPDRGWFRVFRPAPTAPTRLVCFPHAGGSASFFHAFARSMPPAVETLAVQYPGRLDRHAERLIDNIPELADQISEELVRWIDRPMAFFGHSMGATLAFEVATRLADEPGTPFCLFVSGRRAPSRHRHESVHLLDDDGLLAEVRRLDGTGSQLLADPDIVRMVLPALRNDYKAAETYRYVRGRMLACPVVALVGDDDPKVSLAEARAWAEHTTGGFALEVFSGGHFYLNRHAAAVHRVLLERMGTVTGGS